MQQCGLILLEQDHYIYITIYIHVKETVIVWPSAHYPYELCSCRIASHGKYLCKTLLLIK